jgi:hypothetical protein
MIVNERAIEKKERVTVLLVPDASSRFRCQCHSPVSSPPAYMLSAICHLPQNERPIVVVSSFGAAVPLLLLGYWRGKGTIRIQ